VVAEGVAERIVIEALRTAALPDQSPFQISTDPGSGRPQAISSLQIDLINAELERYLNQILSIRQNGFTYDAISRDFELDQRRGFLDALRKFGIFSLKAITNIPIFIWQGWKNFGSAVANRLLGQVRPSYPEIYSGLDKEVRDLQLTLRAYLTDDGKIAQNAATTASFKQEPEVWRELREISLGALDGGTSVRSKSVLPLVNNIYPDPESIIKLDASSFQGLDNLPSELSPLELYEFRRTITGSVKDLDLRIQELYVTLEEHRAAEEVSENEDADPIEGFDSIEIEHSEAIDDVPVDESIKQDAQFESAPIDAKPTSDPGATVKAETQDEGTSTSAAIEDSDETPATAQPMSLELVGGQTSVKAGPSSVSYEEPRVKRRSTPQKKLDQTPTVETKLESQSENDS
jgi:hypothetical protein